MRKKAAPASSADVLLAHVKPLVDRFARQLADTLGTYLNAATERVMGEAIERFENLLGIREDADTVTKPRKASGHNARSCAKSRPTEEPEEDDEPAPVTRGDRFSKIEAAAARRNGASHA